MTSEDGVKIFNMVEEIQKRDTKIEELQEENEQLKEEIKTYQKELEKADSITQSCIFQGEEVSGISFRNCLNKMTDYKQRIDKAIEYITNEKSIETFKTIDSREEWLKVNHKLLEILGGSNE